MLRIRYAQRSDIGVHREHNEDALLALMSEDKTLQEKGALFAVADGLGGLAHGEIASRTAVKTLGDYFKEFEKPRNKNWLCASMEKVNRKIYEINCRAVDSGPMATTLTASWFHGSRLVGGHVGDCRLYRIRNGVLDCLTEDHIFSRHVLSRCIGTEENVTVDRIDSTLVQWDLYLQCSDGLYPLFTSKELLEILTGWPLEEASDRFIKLAYERGAPDNITFQIIRVEEADRDG